MSKISNSILDQAQSAFDRAVRYKRKRLRNYWLAANAGTILSPVLSVAGLYNMNLIMAAGGYMSWITCVTLSTWLSKKYGDTKRSDYFLDPKTAQKFRSSISNPAEYYAPRTFKPKKTNLIHPVWAGHNGPGVISLN